MHFEIHWVKIEYETIEPVIITVSDAIKHNSRFDQTFKIENGDVEKGFEQADHVLDGTFTIGGQEQFYFETQASFILDDEKLGLLKYEKGHKFLLLATILTETVYRVPESLPWTTLMKLTVSFPHNGSQELKKISRQFLVSHRTRFMSEQNDSVAPLVEKKHRMLYQRSLQLSPRSSSIVQ